MGHPHSPSAPAAADAPLIRAAREADRGLDARIAGAGVELARSPAHAIDDETRARAGLLIAAIVDQAQAVLRRAEPALDAAPAIDLPARFVSAGLLEQSGLAAAALLRAEEHRLAAALIRGARNDEEAGPPDDEALAAEAAALRVAEANRLDRSADPLLPLHDLSAEDRHALFWQVAACLADGALAEQKAARAGNEDAMHRAAAGAVARALATIDEGEGIAPAALRYAHASAAAGRLDDSLVAATLARGRVAALAGLLAVRAGIGFDEARAMLMLPARCAVLLRACDIDRAIAIAMILALAWALDRGVGDDPAELVAEIAAGFDALPLEQARAEVRRTRLEPLYRGALARLAAAA